MKRATLTLSDAGWPIIIMAAVNLLLVLCVLFIMQNHLSPHFGYNVRMASSHFVMGMLDRERAKTLTITAGENPLFYLDTAEVQKGWTGLDKALSELGDDLPEHNQITVVIVADAAVSTGNIQRCIDLILRHGHICSVAARPAIEE